MQCPQCGVEARESAKFCRKCGTRFEVACRACGARVAPDDSFCDECGAALAGGPAPAPPRLTPGLLAGRFDSPEVYTPQHLAERIVSSRGALEGERKQVTVLFADLKGSMELLADRDPEEARSILDPVLERMMEAVHRYEGTVNQVMGDGIMALFGAPLAHEDHAVRACYAALRMQEAVYQYADNVFRTLGVRVQIRVGLNSGEVVVRSIGSDLRMDYTAVGQTTHLAARMEQTALPGSVLLASDTLRLAEGYVQVKALGPVPIKGLDAPVEVYELLGAGTARSRLQAAAARGLTKFVGRDTELETLRRTLEQAGSGHGQIVALVGEPGVGKSRLVWEFCHSHRTQDWLVLESRSVSYGKATAYLPVIELLKTYCGVEDRDDARRVREKVTGKLLALDPALQPTLSALLALLDVPLDDATWQTLDPPQRRQRTLDACKRLILRESQEQPLLLVLEDLHWIDAETQTVLDSLVDSLPTARILLLVNYRPEYEHTWHRKTYYQQLRLDPLRAESADELLAALLGDAVELQPLRRLLIERTEGNPFFIEETVRSLAESGVLVGERGAYRLAKALDTAQVPATVQAVLAARIDRLAAEDKRLLQAAAVVGKDVPLALLQAIAEVPDDALRQGLARLQAAEFLYETSLFPEPEYTFKHALTHEVAYGSLLHERRRPLHARIVEAIEQVYPGRLSEHVEHLAHHALRAELWPQAFRYLGEAGAKAVARSAHREAVTDFEQALSTLAYLPPSQELCERGIDLRLELFAPLAALGRHQQALGHIREAAELAEALGDQRRLGLAAVHMSTCFWQAGHHDLAVEAGQRAHTIATVLGDFGLEVVANHVLGRSYYALGALGLAQDFVQRNAVALQGDLGTERFGLPAVVSVVSRVWLAHCLADRGEYVLAMAHAQEAVRLAEAADHPFSLITAYEATGYVHLSEGSPAQAIPMLERGLELCQVWQIPHLFPRIVAALGYGYAMAGRVPEGVHLLDQAVEQAISAEYVVLQSRWAGWMSEACLLGGRRDAAIRLADRALVLAREHKERGTEAWTLRVLGEIAAQTAPPETERAEAHFREALALAEELGMHPLAAHCHLGLGTLYQRVGRHEQGQVELTTAAERYRAMEMPFWLERAETALAQVAG